MKKKITIISIILILLVLFTPFRRYSNIADGVLTGYGSLIASVSICGSTNINETKYEGVIIHILGFEVFNNFDKADK